MKNAIRKFKLTVYEKNIHDQSVVNTMETPIINRRVRLLRYFMTREIMMPFNAYIVVVNQIGYIWSDIRGINYTFKYYTIREIIGIL